MEKWRIKRFVKRESRSFRREPPTLSRGKPDRYLIGVCAPSDFSTPGRNKRFDLCPLAVSLRDDLWIVARSFHLTSFRVYLVSRDLSPAIVVACLLVLVNCAS